MVGGSLGCILLLSLWFLSKDSSTTPGQAAEKSWVPNGVDTDGEISEDESASAPELPSEMQGHKLQVDYGYSVTVPQSFVYM